MLGVSVGNDVVEEDGQWNLVCRRKHKSSLKTFQKLKEGLLVSLLVCQVPGPYRRLVFLLHGLSQQVFFISPLALVRMFSMIGCRSGSLVRLS